MRIDFSWLKEFANILFSFDLSNEQEPRLLVL